MAVYYAAVIEDQSELKQEIERHLVTAGKMRRAKEEADRANEAKAVFLAKMSHQLRTPLNAIIGYSEILMEEGELSGSCHTADLRMINNAGRHLLSLVSDVLHMPKIDAEDIDLCIEQVDLKQLLEDVASTCHPLVTANGNDFALDLCPDLGAMETDQRRLRQILINLLSNAGKFTTNGRVTLRSRCEKSGTLGDEIVISVEDTGIGIAPESMDRLFVEFNQAHEHGSQPYGGTGLGLAVTRALCDVLNARIEVASEPGKGSTFTVRCPVNLELSMYSDAA
jgi:signal transduction histidine kinase